MICVIPLKSLTMDTPVKSSRYGDFPPVTPLSDLNTLKSKLREAYKLLDEKDRGKFQQSECGQQ